MPGTFHQVALVEVIRSNTNTHQVMHQFALDMNTIIYPGQQNGLITQRDTGPAK